MPLVSHSRAEQCHFETNSHQNTALLTDGGGKGETEVASEWKMAILHMAIQGLTHLKTGSASVRDGRTLCLMNTRFGLKTVTPNNYS